MAASALPSLRTTVPGCAALARNCWRRLSEDSEAWGPSSQETCKALRPSHGRPGTIGDNHDSTGSEGGRAHGVDGENVDHAGNGFGLGGVEGFQFAAENGAAFDDGVLQARETRIDAKFRGAVDLLDHFIPVGVVANDGEVGGILERNGLEIGDGKFCRSVSELAIGEKTLARAVQNAAVLARCRCRDSRSSVPRPR